MANNNANPPSSNSCQDLSFITEHLFLGSFQAATNEATLRQHQIRRVFTVTSLIEAIPQNVRVTGVTYWHLVKNDFPSEEMLLDFPDSIDYLSKAIEAKETTLVHCFKGISRSATIVIAYLMHANRWSFDRALKHTKSCRPIVNPNQGFCSQLKLFEHMDFRLNPNNMELRYYMFTKLAFRNYTEKFHQNLADYLKRLAELEKTVKLQINTIYRCRKCSKPLFTDLNLLKSLENVNLLGGCMVSTFPTSLYIHELDATCKYFIIEPNRWMLATGTGQNIFANFPACEYGRIPCPHCNVLIGKFIFYPVLTNLCSCPQHRGLLGLLSVQIHRDYVKKQGTAKKGFFAKLFGTG